MAEGVNKAILVGNLGKDPELSYTQNGTARCRFPLATSESYSNSAGERQERTEWHNIVVWGKLAEFSEKYLTKGKQILIEGRLKTEKWQDRDGNQRYTTKVYAQNITLLGRREESSEGGGKPYGDGGGSSEDFPSQSKAMPEIDTNEDDEVPF